MFAPITHRPRERGAGNLDPSIVTPDHAAANCAILTRLLSPSVENED
jgi:hypothetical protein